MNEVYEREGKWYFKHPVTGEEIGPYDDEDDAHIHWNSVAELKRPE